MDRADLYLKPLPRDGPALSVSCGRSTCQVLPARHLDDNAPADILRAVIPQFNPVGRFPILVSQ